MNKVDKGTRILNYLIDVVAISFINQLVVIVIDGGRIISVAFFLIYFVYYLILESLFGITLGKLVTGSKVVNLNNKKPSFLRVFLRTILRFNPLDWLSYAFGTVQGSHDTMSKTKLVSRT